MSFGMLSAEWNNAFSDNQAVDFELTAPPPNLITNEQLLVDIALFYEL